MKAKITMVMEYEFEINPKNYEGIKDVDSTNNQDCLDWDMKWMRENPSQAIDFFDWHVKEIKGELIEEEATHG